MRRFKWTRFAMIRATAGVLLALVVASPRATAQAPQSAEATPTAWARASDHSSHGTGSSVSLGGDELRGECSSGTDRSRGDRVVPADAAGGTRDLGWHDRVLLARRSCGSRAIGQAASP